MSLRRRSGSQASSRRRASAAEPQLRTAAPLRLKTAAIQSRVSASSSTTSTHSPPSGDATAAGAASTSAAGVGAASAAADAERHGYSPARAAARLSEGLRVLVVDDDEDARQMIGAVLMRFGAGVRLCGTAGEALETLPLWRPDVLVSDIGMPHEDGYDLIRRVRALSPGQGGQTPAVALTAYAREEDRARALAAGYDAHVAKPVESAELVKVVAGFAGRAP